MPNRGQRRHNQEVIAAISEQQAYITGLPGLTEKTLGIRRVFVAEAIRSCGLVSLTMRPRGAANYLDVYGGAISLDRPTGLRGDTVVNDWELPKIEGFRVWFTKTSALVARLDASFSALDVSDRWLRTSDELLQPTISIAEQVVKNTLLSLEMV